MFAGLHTFCLKSTDLAKGRAFYEALGFVVIGERDDSVLLNNGDCEIALMTFLDGNSINFRGADVLAMRDSVMAQGITSDFEPNTYTTDGSTADADGTSWIMIDPDGTGIFFDTNGLESGAAGQSLALWRVLNSAHRQLVLAGASEDCLKTFATKILSPYCKRPDHPHLPTDAVPSKAVPPLGFLSYCVVAKDMEASSKFYGALGFDVVDGEGGGSYRMATNHDLSIALMGFLETNWLNFRGGDPFEIYERLKGAGFELEGEPETYEGEEFNMDEGGAHWQTKDLDGNVVYFDTAASERLTLGDPVLVRKVLERTAHQLENIKADADCRDAFKREMLDRF